MRIFIFLSILFLGWSASAAPVRDQHVSAELISEVSVIQPGAPFWVALKLVHDEHWHTYWINDGDSGLPTRIRWELPDGFEAGPIVWPYPQRIAMPPLVSFGYENEAWLLVEITPPESIGQSTISITGRVSWLMCKEVCIPGRAALTLTMNVGESFVIDENHRAGFAEARRRIPAADTDWTFTLATTAEQIILKAKSPPDAQSLTAIDIFPVDKEVLSNSGTIIKEKTADGYIFTLARENTINPLPDEFRAVLVSRPSLARDPARPAVEIAIPFDASAKQVPARESGSAGAAVPERGLLLVSLFAFIGGIILNLMPCVFPVISLKILGFVKQAGEDPKAVWHHGLIFASGVLVSFWILAGALIALRAGGASIGWGFQLQSPEVLVVLSLLFFVLALNLFGVFELGLSLTAAGSDMTRKQGWAGSFFSGMLATVIATPCTAPFMGVALGYALTQPPYVAMTVFSALALGMAFPYLLLSRYPVLLKRLPRPGPWMETMKQIMGLLLMATVVWLFWVLAALAAPVTLTWVLAAFFLAGVGGWILGKWDVLSRSRGVRWAGRVAGLAFLALAVYTGLSNIQTADAGAQANADWEVFTPERLAELRRDGKPVFIDFTAKWCLTCQVNKLTVLRTAEIMNAFRDRGVALLYADWTDENEIIAAELARHGRQSVPLYVLYGNGTNPDPVLLPELLTRRIVLDALNNLN